MKQDSCFTVEEDDELDFDDNFEDDVQGQEDNSQRLVQSSGSSYHPSQSPEKRDDITTDSQLRFTTGSDSSVVSISGGLGRLPI